MLAWLSSNWGSILVSLILISVLSLIVFRMLKDRKQGKHICSGNCAHCSMCCSCHSEDSVTK